MIITQSTTAAQWQIEPGGSYSAVSESAWVPGGSGVAAIAHFLGGSIKLELRYGTNQGTASGFLPDLWLMSIGGTSVAHIFQKLRAVNVSDEHRRLADVALGKLVEGANKALSA